MSPVEISAIIFSSVFASSLIGMWLRGILPEHHLSAETKDLVKLGVGLVGTMAALLLGLLVASAKNSYDARSNELTQMAASTILLDRLLAHYGPEAGAIRRTLKIAVGRMINQLWPKNEQEGGLTSQARGEVIFDEIQELKPHDDAQRSIQSQAESIAINLGQTRWLLFEQEQTTISTPFLVVVVFWLSMLLLSFGLFAPRNATAALTLMISAISVAGALFLIFELDHPFSGLIQISSAPLHNALQVLGK